jgi:hypothetical protein
MNQKGFQWNRLWLLLSLQIAIICTCLLKKQMIINSQGYLDLYMNEIIHRDIRKSNHHH